MKGVIVVFMAYCFLMSGFIADLGVMQPSWVIDEDFLFNAGLILWAMLIVPYIIGFIDGRDG